ncbi:MAG: signal peptide peptidase SppA, partial [Proteiniphilum sp.]|nr:signal peptide peptidase SppA [Proteiniphilum sp.]
MKDFIKIMFASAVGFLIAQVILSLIAMLLFFGMIGSALSSVTSTKFTLQENSVLNLRLEGSIAERTPEEDPFTSIIGSDYSSVTGLNDIVGAIRKAKNNDKIKGIYLDSRMLSASMATLAEI